MSSAALQSVPHQSTSVGSRSPIVATSSASRTYAPGSPQSRDPYYNQTPTNTVPSSRRSSKRPGANDSPQQPQHYSPSGSAPSPVVGGRVSTSNHASPVIADGPLDYPAMSPGDPQRGVPPIVSPRTSSNRAGADRAKRTGHATESASSPRVTTDGQQDQAERQRSNGNAQANGADKGSDLSPATSASRSRRRAAESPRDTLPHRPAGAREPKGSNPPSAAATGPTSPGLSREGSEVINRVVISKPEVDIDREKARMAEAIPSSPASHQPNTPIGTLSVVGAEGVDDGGRGPRSRHDHSSSTKPEKNTRFGDYFLGNTLGEGEFGKVKMGWKQEGGIQVSYEKTPT